MLEIRIDYTPRVKKILEELEDNRHLWDDKDEIIDLIFINVSDDLERAVNYDYKQLDKITNEIYEIFKKSIDKI